MGYLDGEKHRIFRNRRTTLVLLWDRVKLLTSLWAKAYGAFLEISLTDLQRDNALEVCYHSHPLGVMD